MEQEPIKSPESEKELTLANVVNICIEYLGEEVKEDFDGLDLDEALGYAYTLLLENGIDPAELFEEQTTN